MEARLGADLGAVRVHTDARAAASARAVDAIAYTVGTSIVFDRGRYRPHDPEGRRLLAHELVHAIQQDHATAAHGERLGIAAVDSGAEQEAQRLAGEPGDAAWAAPGTVARAAVSRCVQRTPGDWNGVDYGGQWMDDGNYWVTDPDTGAVSVWLEPEKRWQAISTGSEANVISDDSLSKFHRVERLTGAAIRPTAQLAVSGERPAGPGVAVPGGKATTYASVQILGSPPGHFGFDYQGDDAPNTGWLQFLAAEAETFDASGKSLGFETGVETRFAGHDEMVRWGTSASPVWYLDGEGDTAPYYEAQSTKTLTSGSHTTLPRQTAMYDHPTVDRRVVNAAFDEDGAARVVVRMRFHSYLVRGIEVLYANTMTVSFTLASRSGDPEASRRNDPGTGRPTTRLQAAHFAALLRRFPDWSFYSHD
jgi:hypothetical protein